MKCRIVVSICTIILIGFSCNHNSRLPERAMVLNKIKEIAKLASLECVVGKTIACNKSKWFNRQSATFLAQSEATITLGIDLNKINPENIQIDKRTIHLQLPPIELINFSYPAEKFQEVEKYTVSSFWNTVTIQEKDYAYRMGETAIREQLKLIGITKTAADNVRKLLMPVLTSAGFNEVYIEIAVNETFDNKSDNE